ncbi:CgeB family protein [Lachnotalea glycerini]|uniref:Spore maturation protein CgeB n=1 Tax=Lachnotalea glycerini TaxID=1763509 RepID=A0A371JCW7_9FIRM|nr:glycosyltransferase [Lachnotalea glycerini]RDY30610.1 spore maturation protein CgeB [Lachnotalea glycerini]
MRILFCSWGNICEADLEISLRYMGHEIDVLKAKIKNKDYDADYLNIVSNELLKCRYDCLFSINYIPIISRVCKVHHIKYISWTVDSPWFYFNSETISNDCNYIFIFERQLYERFRKKSTQIYYMPLGTNVKYWDSIKLSEEDRLRFSTDVSFVGSLYEDKHDFDKVEIPDYLRGYFEGIIEAQTNVYGYNFLNAVITDEAVKEFSSCAGWNTLGRDYQVTEREIVLTEFIGKKCAEVERHRVVSKLAKNFKFDLYTLSDTKSMPYVNNKGPADSRIDMPKIFKCSKININMTIKTIETGIPLRVYDIMGCGGFVITNYQSEINEYFIPDVDLVVYESLEDLVYKISYYLQHEEERKKIAQNGYHKVKELYTYEKRLEQIIQSVWKNKCNCYGINSHKSIHQYLALKSLLSQIKITNILDVGLFLYNNESLLDGITPEYIVDGVEIVYQIDHTSKQCIYRNIYKLDNMSDMYYDIIIMIEILKFLKVDEILCLMAQLKRLGHTILVDFDEDYMTLFKSYSEYNVQSLQLGECKLLLITVNEQ